MAQDDPKTDGDRDPSTEWAEDRTDWAEDRTILAAERTFAGWMRTAFAAIGIGLAFRAIFGELQPPWLPKAIATMFIAFAAVFAIGAERRTCKTLARLTTHAVDAPDMPNIRWIAWSVAAGALILIAGLWVLNDGGIAPDANAPAQNAPAQGIENPAP
ncbi:MAG: YidH family protein [Qipengyuania sp.]